MLIDCDSCTVRGAACKGCLVSALFDAPPEVERLDREERIAIEVFARAGFEVDVLSAPPPALRLVPRPGRRHVA
jgi:hypothetical protein